MDAERITDIIQMFEWLRLSRPKSIVGDEVPYRIGLRNWLNGFRSALSSFAPNEMALYHSAYNQIIKTRGWQLTTFGPEREMHTQGWAEEAIAYELLTIEIETWKLLLDKSDRTIVEDFEKYARLRDEGKSPEEVYEISTGDGLKQSTRFKMLRQVFHIEAGRIKEVIGGDGGLSYSTYESKLGEYKAMRDEGKSPQEICSTAISDGLNYMQQIRMLREIFDLSLTEAKEISLIASGVATSLNAHQEGIAQALEETFSDDEDDEITLLG